jgi:hypothetical protein
MKAKESKECRIPESCFYGVTKAQLIKAIEEAFSDNRDYDIVATITEHKNMEGEVTAQNILFGKILEVW